MTERNKLVLIFKTAGIKIEAEFEPNNDLRCFYYYLVIQKLYEKHLLKKIETKNSSTTLVN